MQKQLSFTDPNFLNQNMKLLATEAAERGKLIKDVKYDLKLILPKDKDYFRGQFEATFNLDQSASDPTKTFFLDF